MTHEWYITTLVGLHTIKDYSAYYLLKISLNCASHSLRPF